MLELQAVNEKELQFHLVALNDAHTGDLEGVAKREGASNTPSGPNNSGTQKKAYLSFFLLPDL